MKLIKPELVEGIKCEDVKSEEVENINKDVVPKILDVINDLNKKMRCYGLAAPQFGIKKNYFVKLIGYSKEQNKYVYGTFFNAKYYKEGSRIKSKEGCFSYNLGKDISEVKRYKSIILICDIWNDKDKKLERIRKKIKGFDAIVFQHEIDHLNGITIFYGKK